MQDQNQNILLFVALLFLAAVVIRVVVWGILRILKRSRTSLGRSPISEVTGHATVNRDSQSSHAENTAEESAIKTRLDAVVKHPEYPASLSATPSSVHLYAGSGCIVVFGAIFALAALIMSFIAPRSMGEFGPASFVRVLLLVFAAVGAGLAVWGIFRLVKLSQSRLMRLPALVVDKRIDVSGGGQTSQSSASRVSTSYYVTLALGDGGRRELEAQGKLYGKLAQNDTGVAYIRYRSLLDFRDRKSVV